eukprot:CAMPEP_0114150338 /NCGR_PEP_ID=MMETSP0043_2-20121206/22652_1 /TAXON_ID=464988 /ORGANISM="Hemiselmis andersenii, Strain CCMP644" /LENGTH=151 /DNA_ID=CAMNT_0001245067 /DNA_START=23 /DNA_END=478 /DNA_ORIENTATION=+
MSRFDSWSSSHLIQSHPQRDRLIVPVRSLRDAPTPFNGVAMTLGVRQRFKALTIVNAAIQQHVLERTVIAVELSLLRQCNSHKHGEQQYAGSAGHDVAYYPVLEPSVSPGPAGDLLPSACGRKGSLRGLSGLGFYLGGDLQHSRVDRTAAG